MCFGGLQPDSVQGVKGMSGQGGSSGRRRSPSALPEAADVSPSPASPPLDFSLPLLPLVSAHRFLYFPSCILAPFAHWHVMLRTRFGIALLALFAFLVLLALVSHAEAQSHNDKFYKILGVPKDANARQIKKVRLRKAQVLLAPFERRARTPIPLFIILISLRLPSHDMHGTHFYHNNSSNQPQTLNEQAYRKLSVENHPDRAKDEDERKVMHEKMVELNKAFEVLGDPEKRQMYDTYGEDGPKQQVVNPQANFEYVFPPLQPQIPSKSLLHRTIHPSIV